jgi:transcriptional antiterminator NusG
LHSENNTDEPVEDTPVEETPEETPEGNPEENGAPPPEKATAKKKPESLTSDEVMPTAESLGDVDLPEEGLDWYVIRVQSGREDTLSNKIRKKLQLAGHDRFVRSIVVPKQKISEIKEGKKRVREMKLYPGYFFMEMQLVEEIWYLLRDTPGVGDFVGGGAKPIPMTAKEVRKLIDVLEERERDEAPEVKIEVDKNDTVKIKEGPFENFEGVVEEVQPTKGVIRVMVTIFGRETPVDLEYWQVEKV